MVRRDSLSLTFAEKFPIKVDVVIYIPSIAIAMRGFGAMCRILVFMIAHHMISFLASALMFGFWSRNLVTPHSLRRQKTVFPTRVVSFMGGMQKVITLCTPSPKQKTQK